MDMMGASLVGQVGDGSNNDVNAPRVISHCSDQGAMPLYLIVIGYVLKSLLTLCIEYWLQKRQQQEQAHDHDDDDGNANHVHEKMGSSGNDYIRMIDEEGSNTEKGVTVRSTARCGDRCGCRCRIRCVKVLQGCWTLFKLVSPAIQLVIDIIQVKTSATGSRWNGYQCYVEVFSNSPNVGSLFVLGWTTEAKLEDVASMVRNEQYLTSNYPPLYAWAVMLMCPFLTHTLPFLGAYIWVFLIIAAGWFLVFAIFLAVLQNVFDVDFLGTTPDDAGSIAYEQSFVRWLGMGIVLIFAIGSSTMIRLYSGESSYIHSLWFAMCERTTKEFLYHKVHTAMEARKRWYSFIHYFI
eukprot:gb/GECG01001430.1/.p1 GENE.gb/GECG01001430.1/~~gb/GECG01001430.1/.p1  ORF type:complete len:350 (+),score=30.88 gb/GECG01001430.1/:1-1050(+)